MTDQESFPDEERHLTEVAVRVLEEFRARLLAAGLRFRSPAIEVNVSDPATYSSELRIAFYRDNDLDDVLEFFLFRNGERVVSGHDVEAWLTEQLEEILSA